MTNDESDDLFWQIASNDSHTGSVGPIKIDEKLR